MFCEIIGGALLVLGAAYMIGVYIYFKFKEGK